MKNYFNQLSAQEKLAQLGQAQLLEKEEFTGGVEVLKGKKIVILGCGAQGLNQGLNMRDSGLDVAYALRQSSIDSKRPSFEKATSNNFQVGNFEDLIPTADLVLNLTPDKNHTSAVKQAMPLMKEGACLSYSHGFNVVEEGMEIRKDLTVIMVAPKCPGTEVREEYKRGFGVPTLIAVHPENDPKGTGFEMAKAYAAATGGDRAGVLHSSFVAEVKSDLMGEQTILCGVLQSASLLCFDKMVENGINPNYASKLIQNGWEVQTEALKLGGITHMMDRLNNPSKLKAFELSEELKSTMRPLFQKHMDDIITGAFSERMMKDWANDDQELLTWRAQTAETNFEKTSAQSQEIEEQEYFDYGVLMTAFLKAGIELAYETMVDAGIKEESAYYESLHEAPLIANTIARKKLYEMNRIISDTAEYGCYLFDHSCRPLLKEFMEQIDFKTIGNSYSNGNHAENLELIKVNEQIRSHSIEHVGKKLRQKMTEMKPVV
jgi:ketol-acid reductoisomerase